MKSMSLCFELSSMLDKHKFTLDDSTAKATVVQCMTADTYTELLHTMPAMYATIPWEQTGEDASTM